MAYCDHGNRQAIWRHATPYWFELGAATPLVPKVTVRPLVLDSYYLISVREGLRFRLTITMRFLVTQYHRVRIYPYAVTIS